MKLLNRTNDGKKEYSIADVRKFKTLKDFGLDTNFYGGRIKRIGETSTPGVFVLLDEKSEVFDIMVDDRFEPKPAKEEIPFEEEEEDYTQLTKKELMGILDERGIEYDDRMLKQQLIDLVSQ